MKVHVAVIMSNDRVETTSCIEVAKSEKELLKKVKTYFSECKAKTMKEACEYAESQEEAYDAIQYEVKEM